MLGAICGDVIGSVFEHDNIKSKEFPLLGYGNTFTDDTVMTAAIAEALSVYRKDRDLDEFRQEAAAQMRAFGHRYPRRGYGGTFQRWLQDPSMGPYNSYGNGSAMRVSPVAWVAESLEEAEDLARASAEPTHSHPEGIKGAQAVAGAVYLGRIGESKSVIREYIEKKYYSLDFTLDEIRDSYTFHVSCQRSVPQAIVAFLESTDFEDAVRSAISIGGDSDTIAAIAGSIAEAFYGQVPLDLRARVLWVLDNDLRGCVSRFIFDCEKTRR